MYTPDPNEKFDFQNMDVKLYLVLRSITKSLPGLLEDAGCNDGETDGSVIEAQRVLYEFEQSFGPIPDWAVERNWSYELVPGAQLLTKDGRRMGNAHVVKLVSVQEVFGDARNFMCLTDAGSQFTMREAEVLDHFHIGDWISTPERILSDFDRNNEFMEEPK